MDDALPHEPPLVNPPAAAQPQTLALAYRSGVSEPPPPTWGDVIAGGVLLVASVCLLVISLALLIGSVDSLRHGTIFMAGFTGCLGAGLGFCAVGGGRQALHRFSGEFARRRAESTVRQGDGLEG